MQKINFERLDIKVIEKNKSKNLFEKFFLFIILCIIFESLFIISIQNKPVKVYKNNKVERYIPENEIKNIILLLKNKGLYNKIESMNYTLDSMEIIFLKENIDYENEINPLIKQIKNLKTGHINFVSYSAYLNELTLTIER